MYIDSSFLDLAKDEGAAPAHAFALGWYSHCHLSPFTKNSQQEKRKKQEKVCGLDPCPGRRAKAYLFRDVSTEAPTASRFCFQGGR